MTNAQKISQALMHASPWSPSCAGSRPPKPCPSARRWSSHGWTLIEMPLNSPQPLDSIAADGQRLPDAWIGAGTVLSAEDVRNVHAAGGELIVSPNFNAAVVREAARLGMVCLPGVMTPARPLARSHRAPPGSRFSRPR
jgi:2-dehydro-3-deoxyphosphogalactonate aldolase